MADQTPLPPPTKPAPWWAVIGLAYFAMIIFTFALFQVINLKETQLLSNMIIAIIGFVGGGLGFYWGSNSSSSKKDDTTAALGAALATSTPVVNESPPSSLVAAMTESRAAHQ